MVCKCEGILMVVPALTFPCLEADIVNRGELTLMDLSVMAGMRTNVPTSWAWREPFLDCSSGNQPRLEGMLFLNGMNYGSHSWAMAHLTISVLTPLS
ncbi:uncharacterized protein C8Q71DRAFT_356500 [Rhodofomes roseus]|uniref:Uncharacterized protein n=1 Tax=Rhodofomes roseus TaxID=34475 RepID=A0ABQ8KU46_9APHY|nr:uncharacterized protein C8Q71DRAFT_356500 [Rhodofomes roseus]KAH9841951.1 hypothetical protein C8Q71DRAFT_356500 [Rhodofomes roseus]